MNRPSAFALILGMGALLTAAPGLALIETHVEADDNEVSATVSTMEHTIELTLTFENAIGLNVQSLGLSAEMVSPTDPTLLARLPSGVSLPAALPLLIAIEPPTNGALSFSGLATLELHTHDLEFTAGCPFRIFASHDGGAFEDVTDFMGTGSYRGRGRTGGFSDFLILADVRPAADVVDAKLARLWTVLNEQGEAIEESAFTALYDALSAADAAWGAGDPAAARSYLDDFVDAVENASGEGIPDVWRSAGDLVNVAGEMRATAATLRFSLSLAN